MPESSVPADEPDTGEEADGAQRAETQEERALRAMQAIWGGADLGEETMKLSNEFTDRHTARFTGWIRRVVLRRK